MTCSPSCLTKCMMMISFFRSKAIVQLLQSSPKDFEEPNKQKDDRAAAKSTVFHRFSIAISL